ncbi:MAG: prepilin-type N-terminal cleavage/methylation domain-containing protein [Opitutaceae bacterium]|jgi:prepilin-type N-terminal cleavage/methylation domain-containing protein/prepilin-type processing-associated H-X9-DG protein|nr:prepilin-type N-terminal cleavage/methylation domain-containing protein [Opitutaceae bacterium]
MNTRSEIAPPARAFTLIELLTVIAIIGILAAIIIPTVGAVRGAADRAKALSNLRQVTMSLLFYADDNKGLVPAIDGKNLNPAKPGWIYVLVEEGYLADPISNAGITPPVRKRCLQQLYNPVTRKLYPDETIWNTGGWGLLDFGQMFRRHTIREFTAPSRQVMIADGNMGTTGNCDWSLSRVGNLWPNTKTKGGANYGFCDGHVKWLKAQDPSQPNSRPEGENEAVFFHNSTGAPL